MNKNRSIKSFVFDYLGTFHPEQRWLIGFSGGLDSTVLLSLCAEYAKDYHRVIEAIHINHQLSPNALSWQKHCQMICQQLAVPLRLFSIDLSSQDNMSPEERARVARYAQFATQLNLDDVLFTAHHQDDQAETVLLQLLRGSGPKGLAAMPMKAPFAKGYHCRPLLAFSREQLQAFSEQFCLNWIEDESNQNTDFDRNYIRQEVLPIIQKRWPSYYKNLARTALNCAETLQLSEEYANKLLSDCRRDNAICIKTLLNYSLETQRIILRAWLQSLHLPIPTRTQLEQLQSDSLYCAEDAQPCIKWSNVEVRRFQQLLYANEPLPSNDETLVLQWDGISTLELPGQLGVITPDQIPALPSKQLTIRFRQGGERCKPKGSYHTRALKTLFQEWGIPPWLRSRVPLIYNYDKIIAIAGYCICE